MALPYAPSSAITSTLSTTNNKTSFLGFTFASVKPSSSVRTLNNNNNNSKQQSLRIRCQNLTAVPKDERWMFEDSEIGGPDIWNKTWYPKADDHVNTEKKWYVVDAKDKILGRLASTIAIHIRAGDRTFNTLPGRIFASIWLLVSTLAVARAFLYLAEARVDKRQRTMTKWVLHQDMTVKEFLAADMGQNGYVSKSEYVIYKLKVMNKIAEKDIQQICAQFDRLDEGKCGKITLADLWENRH